MRHVYVKKCKIKHKNFRLLFPASGVHYGGCLSFTATVRCGKAAFCFRLSVTLLSSSWK